MRRPQKASEGPRSPRKAPERHRRPQKATEGPRRLRKAPDRRRQKAPEGPRMRQKAPEIARRPQKAPEVPRRPQKAPEGHRKPQMATEGHKGPTCRKRIADRRSLMGADRRLQITDGSRSPIADRGWGVGGSGVAVKSARPKGCRAC